MDRLCLTLKKTMLAASVLFCCLLQVVPRFPGGSSPSYTAPPGVQGSEVAVNKFARQGSTPAGAINSRRGEITYNAGLYDFQVKDSAGRLVSSQTYLDKSLQRPHGKHWFFYPDGKVARMETYEEGLPQGSWKRFYPDGSVASIREYELGSLASVRYITRQGMVIEQKPSGLIGKKEMVFFDDELEREDELVYATYYGLPARLRNGMYAMEVYSMDGSKRALVHFSNSSFRNKTGPFYWYEPSGAIRIQAQHQDNRLHGRFITWHPNGRLSDSGAMYQGRPDGHWQRWHNNGQKRDSGDFYRGLKQGFWKSWHPDGSLRDSGYYVKGYREGLWTVIDPDKQIRGTGLYRLGMESGQWKYYDKTGRILFVRSFKKPNLRNIDYETIGVRDE